MTKLNKFRKIMSQAAKSGSDVEINYNNFILLEEPTKIKTTQEYQYLIITGWDGAESEVIKQYVVSYEIHDKDHIYIRDLKDKDANTTMYDYVNSITNRRIDSVNVSYEF